ncbi:Fe(3+)-hydroxamate ABC transporter permease FhuB [Rhodovibrio salinarum]|uniref:Fe(3+)-hydroxamate ABC transporter permease FhuB n=1 Tax=Rhodovibrio salinarum TaxID=1087 RepID=A0A934QK03_9PROT|nr:Fe(3+)-hydroxamate ABC transporter permease FhuB [Rhodovibrio salinarum]MBK1697955.1 Fe(3+)-hydroxamate ABC transporter permease FhuB [Rhodovibrio salinarum]
MTTASLRPTILPWACGLLLVVATLAVTGANLHALGGLEDIWRALEQPASASFEAVKLLYGFAPRLAVSFVAGAGLAAAGTVMQQVLRNPIASPMTLGVAAGAQLALSLITLLAPELLASLREPAAMVGGSLALALVLALGWRRQLDPATVVLAGLVISLYLGAVNAGLLLLFQYDLNGLLIWGSGVLTQHDWSELTFLLPRLAAGLLALTLLQRPLSVMTLDDGSAHGLGLNLQRARVLTLAVAVYLTTCVVSAVGVIAFIGLAAPALTRLLGARRMRQRLLWAPAVGGLLLTLADQLVQSLAGVLPGLLPTGALTALVGAPIMLWLLRGMHAKMPAGQGAYFTAVQGTGWPAVSLIWLSLPVVLLLAMTVVHAPDGWIVQAPSAVLAEAPWRLPRLLSAAAAGLLLGVAGTLLQRLLHNPLASPESLGLSGGALTGVVVAMFILPTAGHTLLLGAGTLGALAVVGGLMIFAQRAGYAPERVLLVGIALKAVFDAIVGLVAVSGTPFWVELLNWISGSTYNTDWTTVAGTAGTAAIVLPLALALARWIELIALGDEQAEARGLAVGYARTLLLLLAALATAAATLLVGPLSFVGLMAPHLASMLGLRRARAQILGACGLGVGLLALADWVGRAVLLPYELPAGLAACLIGGVYFMWLLRRL